MDNDIRAARTFADMAEGRELKANEVEIGGVKVVELESFPPHANPFAHDLYHMGTYIGNNVCIMHGDAGSHNRTNYLIVVNMATGKRLRLTFPE